MLGSLSSSSCSTPEGSSSESSWNSELSIDPNEELEDLEVEVYAIDALP